MTLLEIVEDVKQQLLKTEVGKEIPITLTQEQFDYLLECIEEHKELAAREFTAGYHTHELETRSVRHEMGG